MKSKKFLAGLMACSLVCVPLSDVHYNIGTYIVAEATDLSEADKFIASAEVSEGNIYDGSVETDSFKMNGRTYYTGVLLDTTSYSSDKTSEIDLNVEDINDFSCVFGHIDNGRTGSATVSVYLDTILVDKFEMTSTMPLKDYSIDTSDSSKLKFTVVRKGGSAYGIADVVIDGKSSAKDYIIPKYSTSEAFVDDSFNREELNMRDAVSESDVFEMNGRVYYKGVLFNTTSYSSDMTSRLDFNVENVDKFSCTFGHIDNGRTGNATVSVYLDDVLVDKFEMTSTMMLKDYSIDTSDSSTLRFSIIRKGGSAYGMADFIIDGIKPKKNHIVPEYSTSEAFVDDSFNNEELNMIDAVSEFDTFEMNGRTYYKGVLFNTTSYSSDMTSRLDFNVENVDKFSCTFGHIDNGRTGNATVSVYLDDVLFEKFDLTSTMMLKDYSIDTSDSSTLRFSIIRKGGSAYGMADVIIDGIKPKKDHIVPEYSTSEAFVDDSFNNEELNMIDAVSEFDTFEMNGRIYYKGVLFNTTSYSSDMTSRLDFNVENVNKFSCTFGHIDNGRTGNATVSVYLDDVLVDKFEMTSTMPLKDYSIDTSDSSILRFSIIRKGGSAYGMADVIIDGIKPKKNHVVPEYETAIDFMKDCYNLTEANISDVVSSYDAFKMNGKEYYKGILLNTTSYSSDMTSRIDFNVENVKEISFDIAHLDGGKEGNATVSVYLDDVLTEKFELTADMVTKRYTVDVSDSDNIRFEVLRKSGSAYAFADFEIVSGFAEKGISGDANSDGEVNIADAVMLQKWLLRTGNLPNWQNVDLCEDGRIDVFDMVMMRKLLIENK